MKSILLAFALSFSFLAHAQLTPEITSWVVNTNNAVGYNNILTNVLSVDYTDNNVFVSSSCIPGYDIGPWAGNPNTPENQDFCFKITRNPEENTAAKINTPMGHTGVWRNGVSIFNAKDGFSYNDLDIWHQDALIWEGSSFDDCLGHSAGNGEYHHHINPTCLYDDTDDQNHSPIIGYAFDGFPIYGAYAYSNSNGSGEISRMESSYQLRAISVRETLSDGTTLDPSEYGPAINTQYPIGSFLEDYEYVPGSGNLDEHNGRFCITPDYPNGIYTYFVTIDMYRDPVYPYTLGLTYYGTVQNGNMGGPQSGHNTIPDNATNYDATTSIETTKNQLASVYPNPTQDILFIQNPKENQLTILNILGETIFSSFGKNWNLNVRSWNNGVYLVKIGSHTERLVISH